MGGYKNKNGTSKVGDLLRKIGQSDLLGKAINVAGSVASGDFLGAVKDLVSKSSDMSVEDKEIVLKQVDLELAEMQEVSKRWSADMMSDSWLSKNIRPLTLASLLLFTYIIIVADSTGLDFTVKEHWATMISSLLITTIGAYFGIRGAEKIFGNKKK